MARAVRFKQNPGNEAFAYYRYSSAAQRDVSIEEQREAAHRYADEHGLIIVKEFEDHAMSGTRDDRPGFLDMLWSAEHLHPAVLILWKSDRLSRDRYDAVIAKSRLRSAGTRIEYVAEPMPEDEASRELLEAVREALDDNFIKQHRRNVMRGLTYNAENCLYNGVRVLGYRGAPDKTYEIDEDEAAIVRKIFRDYGSGVPMKKIADELASKGIKSSRGGKMTINSLRAILTNDSYIGVYSWGDVRVEGGMPRIISDSEWEAVQEKLKKNSRGGRPVARKPDASEMPDFWLTGKAYCGVCGLPMHGISGTGRHDKTYYYYACAGHVKHKCKKKNIRKEFLQEIVSDAIDEALSDPSVTLIMAEACYSYYKQQNEDSEFLGKELDNRLKEVNKKLDNFVKAIENGIFNPDTQKRMEELEAERDDLNSQKESWEVRQKYELKESDVLKYLRSFTDRSMKDTEGRARLLDSLVQKIFVYDDHVEIVLRYIDGPKKVVFEDYKDARENGPLRYLLHPGDKGYKASLEKTQENGSTTGCCSPCIDGIAG